MRIINASKRTDLPTFYRTMLARHMSMTSKDTFYILWTKNIVPFWKEFKQVLINHPNWYIQHTLTPYGSDIENVPNKKEIIRTIQEISKEFGQNRVVVRYDPILFTDKYNMAFHVEGFERLFNHMIGHIDTITFSYLDWYKSLPKDLLIPSPLQQADLAKEFAKIVEGSDIKLSTCAEPIMLNHMNITKAQCVDPLRIESIAQCSLSSHDSVHQRKECGCIKAEDIGSYGHPCLHKCKYCYGSHGK